MIIRIISIAWSNNEERRFPCVLGLMWKIMSRLVMHFRVIMTLIHQTTIMRILYINSVNLSVCPGRYILNPCEQGVVFVFNVPSWTCLFVYLCGQKLGSAWKILPVIARSLWSIWSWFLFFSWRGGRGGGGVLGVLIGGSEKEHIVILCWGTHWEPKKNEKKPSPPWPLLPKFKRNKSKAPWVHPWAFHWLHEISIPKRVRHHLEPEWKMRRTGWGGLTGCIMH
jgi:hypothetical protein